MGLNHISRAKRDQTWKEDIITNGLGRVEGIAVDWIAGQYTLCSSPTPAASFCLYRCVTSVAVLLGFTDWFVSQGNIYWTDHGFNLIEIARLNGWYRSAVISQELDQPRAIAVHPVRGYVPSSKPLC